MNKLQLAILTIALFGLFSCNSYKAEYDQMINEKAALEKKLNALEEEDKLIRGEYSDAIETLNSIEDTLRAIADREKEIQKLSNSNEFSGSLTQKQAIMNKLQTLSAANDASKEEMKKLQSRIKAYKIENEQMKKMIAKAEEKVLQKERELEEAHGLIEDLRRTLNKLEGQLLEKTGELAATYEVLKNERDALEKTNQELQRTLADLQKKTSFIGDQAKGYFACGTKAELRRVGILNKTTVKLVKEYQEAIRASGSTIDFYNNNEFDCNGEGEIEVILPERDPSSYEIQGNKLIVKNTKTFWATDKVVVLVLK